MKNDRAESIIQIIILLGIAGMAGAASFTHVHNWTMSNAPAHTGSWFGWANAVISELTPLAAGIEIRKRHRKNQTIGYPVFLVVAAVALSLSAQISQAKPTVGGWVSVAVPVLGFLALVKLVLSSPRTKKEAPEWNQNEPGNQASTSTGTPAPEATAASSSATTAPAVTTSSSAPPPGPTPETPETPVPTSMKTDSPVFAASSDPTSAPADSTRTPEPEPETDTLGSLVPEPSAQLLMSGRMAAFAHQQATGHPISPGELADRMDITPGDAGTILQHLGITAPTVTTVNGYALNGSRP